jgi:hypothetical protein
MIDRASRFHVIRKTGQWRLPAGERRKRGCGIQCSYDLYSRTLFLTLNVEKQRLMCWFKFLLIIRRRICSVNLTHLVGELYYMCRDVNLHLSERIPAGIAPFGAPETGISSPWGRGWRQKFPRSQFGAGNGEAASVPADSPNPSIYS